MTFPSLFRHLTQLLFPQPQLYSIIRIAKLFSIFAFAIFLFPSAAIESIIPINQTLELFIFFFSVYKPKKILYIGIHIR